MKNQSFPPLDALSFLADQYSEIPSPWPGFRQWGLILLCCVITTTAGIALYHYAIHKHVAFGVVNLGQVYREKEQEFTNTITAQGVTDADRDKAIKSAQDFAARLPKAMQALSDDCGCVVLMGNAVGGVPAGVIDLTPALRKKVGL
jgi:hypothetical protein